jgi:DNA ligase-1
VKKDYLEGMTDSLDLVPIGAWHGRGKRTGKFGGYLLACYNDEEEEYQTISVVGTGFSDVQLEEFTKLLTPEIVEKKPKYYRVGEGKQAKPDVWLNPACVWEIKAADLSISPVHMAGCGLVHESKGIALRFPRILRVRDDKKPEDATTAQQVADMYQNQFSNTGSIGYGIDNDQQRSLKQYKADTLAK